MSECHRDVRRLLQSFELSTSIVLDTIRVAPVLFTVAYLAFSTAVIAVGRTDNLAFAKIILSRKRRIVSQAP
jgi:hypothetical protein